MTRAERYGAPVVKEEPFLFMDGESTDVGLFSKFYELDQDFPKDQFLVRSEGERNKTIYFVSEAVKSILKSEDIHRLRVSPSSSSCSMFGRAIWICCLPLTPFPFQLTLLTRWSTLA
jgi:hypothetical protein